VRCGNAAGGHHGIETVIGASNSIRMMQKPDSTIRATRKWSLDHLVALVL
jgi:hypothetical protein